MRKEQNNLDALFAKARTQAPKKSFSDIEKVVMKVGTVGVLAGIVRWFMVSSKIVKISIMTSLITAITVVSILVVQPYSNNNNKENFSQPIEKGRVNSANKNENIDSINENDFEIAPLKKQEKKQGRKSVDDLPVRNLNTPSLNENSILSITEKEKDAPLIDSTFKTKQVRYMITEKTTEAELEEIKLAAGNAAINVKLNYKIKRDRIKKLSFALSFRKENDMQKSSIYISGSDSFSVSVGWTVDEQGNVIDIDNSDSITAPAGTLE